MGLVRQVPFERFDEYRRGISGQAQGSHIGPHSTRLLASFENRHQVAIAQARDEWGDEHARFDACRTQVSQSLNAPRGRGSIGFQGPGYLRVEKWDTHCHPDGGPLSQTNDEIEIALDQRRLGNDVDRVRRFDADFEAASREPEALLDGLVTVGVPAQDDEIPLPGAFVQRTPQQFRGSTLDQDLAFEIGSRSEAEHFVAGTRVAIGTAVQAPSVGIYAVSKANVRTLVLRQDGLGLILVDHEILLGSLAILVLDEPLVEAVGRIECRQGAHHEEG